MNIKTLKLALPYMFETGIVPMLVGPHGVGKSTAIKEYAQENNLELIDLRLGNMDVGDLLGLADFETDSEGNKVATRFFRPEWFPQEGTSGILFVDEINRAQRHVLQAVFQLVLDKRIHSHILPKGWTVVAAMNPDTEDYVVTDINDKAFLDRFCFIQISTSHRDFIQYGQEKNFSSEVLRFIDNMPEYLSGKTTEMDMNLVEPSPRSWEKVSKVKGLVGIDQQIQREIICGLIGVPAATQFLNWSENQEKPVTGEQIIEGYKKVRKVIQEQAMSENFRSDLLNQTKDLVIKDLEVMHKDQDLEKFTVSDKVYRNLMDFAFDLPNDVAMDFLRKLVEFPNLFLRLITDEEETLGMKLDALDPMKKETA